MGCDIHAHVEVKVGGAWHHYTVLSIKRNYQLFAKMAGVRNYDEVEPITEPRGLPPDLSVLTKIDWDRGEKNWHTPSWLNGSEIEQIIDWHQKQRNNWNLDFFQVADQWGYLFGNGYDIAKYPSDYPKEIQDIRLVFWFDN